MKARVRWSIVAVGVTLILGSVRIERAGKVHSSLPGLLAGVGGLDIVRREIVEAVEGIIYGIHRRHGQA